MTGSTLIHCIFYLYAVIAIIAALRVVTTSNPVVSVLSLVVAFFAMAAIWMLLEAEFLAIILVLVYVGAVMTLFLFVVMMLNIDKESKRGGFVRYFPFGLALMLVMAGLLIVSMNPNYFRMPGAETVAPVSSEVSNIALLGNLLYTQYAYPFEIAGFILLTAMIAAITLAHRAPRRRKVQHISQQLAVRAEDRVRLLDISSEKPLTNGGETSCRH